MLPLNDVNMSAVQSAPATCPSVERLKQLELLKKRSLSPAVFLTRRNLLHNQKLRKPSAPVCHGNHKETPVMVVRGFLIY